MVATIGRGERRRKGWRIPSGVLGRVLRHQAVPRPLIFHVDDVFVAGGWRKIVRKL